MNEQNNNWTVFIAGVLAGGVAAYLLFSDDSKKIIEELKKKASKIKDELGEEFGGLKDVLNDLK
jgi:hypothetical protein